MIKKIKVKKSQENIRLDKWLKLNFSSLTQSFIEKNLRKKNILLNGKVVISKFKVAFNDEVLIYNYNSENYRHHPKVKKIINIPSKINYLYESSIIQNNNNFFIIDKWSGISTQGGSKINISIDSIIKNKSTNFNLVHRLDKDTSGLLIVAKNLEYTKIFGNLFKSQEIMKIYFALCQGKPNSSESFVELDVPSKENKKIAIQTQTYFKLLNYKNGISQLLFIPKTGKTHQLRIVSKSLGCPIIGDRKYNHSEIFSNEELKLNAHILKFQIKSKKFNFQSTIPEHFIKLIKKNNLKNFNNLNFDL
ncbi:MAG: Ribosomal large subunit pseudouridine synthase C [Alphaproteobacteria bacterium MarineAlpha5_Bin5]|nr:MAG: Ribosomal large subunit pseudouridine synthase C [Alphaproteobacteria bacterium MarineAlpha5_Bin5]